MDALYTVGYTKKSLRDFITRLRGAGVDCVVDIRLQNTSQLAGFAKKDDLGFLLEDGFGIGYTHMVDLAPSEGMLADYKADKDWKRYHERYAALIEERGMVHAFLRAARDAGWRRPCLLCAEDAPDKCHRRILAEAIADEVDGLEVSHL